MISNTSQKVQQILQKSQTLLQEKKAYQYAQKILALSNRRLQSNKPEQSLLLLQGAARNLLKIGQISQGSDLFSRWVKLLQSHPNLFDQENTANIGLQLYLYGESQLRGDILQSLFKKFYKKFIEIDTKNNEKRIQKEYCWRLGCQFIRLDKFSRAQKYFVLLGLQDGINLLNEWSKKIEKDQVSIIYTRFALLKAIHGRFDQTQVVLKLCPQSGFKTFGLLIVKSLRIKSKDGYQKIGKCYEYLLQKQDGLKNIYQQIGARFFSMTKSSKSGLLAMFS